MALDRLQGVMERLGVPPHYCSAPSHMVAAVGLEIIGVQDGGEAIVSGDDAEWADSNQKITDGLALINVALGQYPK